MSALGDVHCQLTHIQQLDNGRQPRTPCTLLPAPCTPLLAGHPACPLPPLPLLPHTSVMCRLCACRRPPPPSPPPRPPRPPMPECSCQSFTDVWWNVQILNQSGERCAALRNAPHSCVGLGSACTVACAAIHSGRSRCRRVQHGSPQHARAGGEGHGGRMACGSASGAAGAATTAQHAQRGVQGVLSSPAPSPCPPCLPNLPPCRPRHPPDLLLGLQLCMAGRVQE